MQAEKLFPKLCLLNGSEFVEFVPVREPDALVLVTMQTQCKCGASHSAPNARMMLRYGRNLRRVSGWKAYYNLLPREHYPHVENVAACTECFERSNWSFEDFE